MPKIDFKDDGIGHFVKDKFLRVPIFQRSYAWEKSNIQDLLEDIRNSYPEDYFIGTIVVTNKDDYLEIVDGQQRLATISIIFATVRDLLRENDNKRKADIIENSYLFEESLREDKKQKLRLNNVDNDFYLKKVIEHCDIKTTKESHKRIEKAYELIKEFVKNEFEDKGADHIFDLVEYIEKNLKVIIVSASDEVNAFTIFETLNDRGLALSQTDLIKNYLFNKSDDRINETQEIWARFTGAIEATENEDEILQYIRYYWSSKNGLTREKELFRNIKNNIRNKNHAITLLTNLDKNTQLYLAILNPNHPYWKDYPPNCTEYIRELRELKLRQNRPLLLAILKRFEVREVEKSLKLVVSWSVRNLITGLIGAGTLEKEFSNQAKLINEGKIKKALKLRESIKNIVPTDEQFNKSFKIASVSKSYIARYYLTEIEKSYRTTTELSIIKNPEKINLEHILPVSPLNLDDWSGVDGEIHKTYYKRIGNLTLLDKKMNSEQGNDKFDIKKGLYRDSEVIITKKLCEYEKWSSESIDRRQKEFADRAVEIWSLEI